VSSHFDLGIAYREMKLFEDAIGEFSLAINEGLQVPHSHQLVGQSHLDLGQIDEAVYHLQASLAHAQPVDLAAYAQYRLGLTYELIGNADDAMACFAQIAERYDLFPDIQQRMGGLGR
jgi:tetratricopeptide (TPR) repeat protein